MFQVQVININYDLYLGFIYLGCMLIVPTSMFWFLYVAKFLQYRKNCIVFSVFSSVLSVLYVFIIMFLCIVVKRNIS